MRASGANVPGPKSRISLVPAFSRGSETAKVFSYVAWPEKYRVSSSSVQEYSRATCRFGPGAKVTSQSPERSSDAGAGAGEVPVSGRFSLEKISTRDSYGARSTATDVTLVEAVASADPGLPVKGSHHCSSRPVTRTAALVWTGWLPVFTTKYASAPSSLRCTKPTDAEPVEKSGASTVASVLPSDCSSCTRRPRAPAA